jgi:proteasome lid subunit RPN8/RPN11
MIVVSAAHLQAIRAEAERAWPEECCGLLVGEADDRGAVQISAVVPGVNLSPDRRLGFEVDPQLRFDLTRRLRDSDQRIVGHYHSHPNGPAEPSATDRARAIEPALVWLIVAVTEGRAGPVAAFHSATDPATGAPSLSAIEVRERREPSGAVDRPTARKK